MTPRLRPSGDGQSLEAHLGGLELGGAGAIDGDKLFPVGRGMTGTRREKYCMQYYCKMLLN